MQQTVREQREETRCGYKVEGLFIVQYRTLKIVGCNDSFRVHLLLQVEAIA